MAEKKPITQRWWFWVILVLLGFTILGIILDDDETTDTVSNSTPEPYIETTIEPTPEPTMEPISTESNESYYEFIVSTSEDLGNYLSYFGEQNIALSEDVSLLNDDDWILDTATYAVLIQSCCNEVIDYNVALIPEQYIDIHNEYVLGCQYYDDAITKYTDAIDSLDSELLGEAMELLQKGNDHINTASSHAISLIE